MGKRFPGIVAGLEALPAPSLVLDGEVVVFDEGLVSYLGYLIGRVEPEGVVTLRMLISFDCLGARGRDLTREPLRERLAVWSSNWPG